jgi:hypothetical protein
MPDETTTDVLPCGCGDTLVCERHRRLAEYATAFRGDRASPSQLPDLVLQASFKTWFSEVDRFRKVLFLVFVIVAPVVTSIVGRNVLFGMVVFLLFAVPISVLLLTIPNNRLVLDPRAKKVTFRNWRRKSVVLPVDDQMRAAAFQYLDIGVTQSAITVVLWTPTGVARMDQRAWGYSQLEDLVVVLGVSVGGLAGDKEIEAAFPGTLPTLAKHPVASAFGVVAFIAVLVVAAAIIVSLPDDNQPDVRAREPSVTNLNGPKPASMPPEVASRHDALNAALQQAVGVTEWTAETEIHPCPEQDGWQRETTYTSVGGGVTPDVAAQFTDAAEDHGLVVDTADTSDAGTLTISTEYGSDTGADARVYVRDYETSGKFYDARLVTNSECV